MILQEVDPSARNRVHTFCEFVLPAYIVLFEWLLEATIDPGSRNHEYGSGTIYNRYAFIFFSVGILDPMPFFAARFPGFTDLG